MQHLSGGENSIGFHCRRDLIIKWTTQVDSGQTFVILSDKKTS